jgi:hypothetical protein
VSNTKQPTLKHLIEEECQNRSTHRWCGISKELMEMSPELREEFEIRESIRFGLDYHFQNMVSDVLKDCTRPKCLLALPAALASNCDIGTNVVMHLIVSDDISPRRRKYVDELRNNIWMRSSFYTPTVSQLLGFFCRMENGASGLKGCTVAECYWLLEVSEFAGCASPFFSMRVNEVIAVATSGREDQFDFLRVLDPVNVLDKVLLSATVEQYERLERTLGRI